ncbi:MAG: CDP-alcohol phosphatidyltransferase family protein [Planctomycetes bacterium]|nr:CDP-alcohol phosphatidyltransferase family protein [Planctomycetota bacterium]
MSLANKITFTRLFMTLIYLIYLGFHVTSSKVVDTLVLDVCCTVFLFLSILDVVDGIVARSMNQSTKLGRILDPLVDKVSVGGSLILFLGIVDLSEIILPWMVVVVVLREFYVSSIRFVAEERGIEFPANLWGRLKTLSEVVVIVGCFLYISHLKNFDQSGYVLAVLKALIVVMLSSVVLSSIIYTVLLFRAMNEQNSNSNKN